MATTSRRQFLQASVAAALALAAAPLGPVSVLAHPSATAAARLLRKQYQGVVIKYIGLGSMGAMVERFAQPWFEQTGARMDRGEFGQQEIEEKILQAMATDSYLGDLVQFNSPSSGDVMGGGWLLPVPDAIKQKVEMDDVLPLFRDKILSWNGVQYALPYDGDKHYMAYRGDLAANPDNQVKFKEKFGYDLDPKGPKTWQEHRNWAEFFTGWDWDTSVRGQKAGFSHMMKRKDTLWWGFCSRASAYAKHPEDPSFLFDVETFAPRINSPAFVRALTEWKEEAEKWGITGVLQHGWGEVLQAWGGGRVAMCLGWSDHGTIANDETQSVIKGKDRYAITPGSKEVYNAKTGAWENFPEISYAPFIAFGGWVLAVPKSSRQVEAAWDLAAFISGKETSLKMTAGAATGCNPLRYSHMDPDVWVNGDLHFSRESAESYLAAEKATIEHPNAVLDLRIPGFTQYRDAGELAFAQALAGELPVQQALDECAKAWDQITERLGGREKQLVYYKAAVGVT